MISNPKRIRESRMQRELMKYLPEALERIPWEVTAEEVMGAIQLVRLFQRDVQTAMDTCTRSGLSEDSKKMLVLWNLLKDWVYRGDLRIRRSWTSPQILNYYGLSDDFIRMWEQLAAGKSKTTITMAACLANLYYEYYLHEYTSDDFKPERAEMERAREFVMEQLMEKMES